MSKIRVYELAKMLGKSNKELLDHLADLGVDVKTHMSSIDNETARLLEEVLAEDKPDTVQKPEKEERKVIKSATVEVSSGSTVKAVAELL